MYRPRWALLCVLAACGGGGHDTEPDASAPTDAPTAADAAAADAAVADAAPDAAPADAGVDAIPDADPPDADPSSVVVRIAAANITSGNGQRYEEPGIRILQGLRPDVVLIQELNVGDNSPAALRAFVTTAFGADFGFYREPVAGIPNGIVSRYPILATGSWDDPEMTNREFAYARIDIPGDVDLWAVSVHLKAGSEQARRQTEARALASAIAATVPAGDYLVVGGDFNTGSRTEPCLTELAATVQVGGPWPTDQGGDGDTNAGRNDPYDWVLFDADLATHVVPVAVGANRHPVGLVFDSRRYTPLDAVAPVLVGDSGATNMQHMAVVRDVRVP